MPIVDASSDHTSDMSSLAASLILELRSLREGHERTRYKATALYQFLQLVTAKLTAFKPRYGSLGLKLLRFADYHGLKLQKRLPYDTDEVYLKSLSEEISALISNAKRGDAPSFVRALLHCVWASNDDLGILSEHPILRGNQPILDWIELVKEQIALEWSQIQTASVPEVRTAALTQITSRKKILFVEFRIIDPNVTKTLSKLKELLSSNNCVISTFDFSRDKLEYSAVEFAKSITDQRADFVILYISRTLLNTCVSKPLIKSSLQLLFDTFSNLLVFSNESTQGRLELLGMSCKDQILLDIEVGASILFDDILKAIKYKELGESEYSRNINVMRRIFFGKTALKRVFDQDLNNPELTEGTLFLFEIDGFSDINKTFGLAIGDIIVEETRNALLEAARLANGKAEQFGNGKFFLKVPLESGIRYARKVIKFINGFGWQELAIGLRVTLSVGFALKVPSTPFLSSNTIEKASLGLIAAKNLGGNRVEFGPVEVADELWID